MTNTLGYCKNVMMLLGSLKNLKFFFQCFSGFQIEERMKTIELFLIYINHCYVIHLFRTSWKMFYSSQFGYFWTFFIIGPNFVSTYLAGREKRIDWIIEKKNKIILIHMLPIDIQGDGYFLYAFKLIWK